MVLNTQMECVGSNVLVSPKKAMVKIEEDWVKKF